MNKMLAVTAAAMTFASAAFGQTAAKAALTPEQRQARREAKRAAHAARIEREGGAVTGRTAGTALRIVDAGSGVDGALLGEVARAIQDMTRFAVETRTAAGGGAARRIWRDAAADGKAAAVVVVVADDEEPTLAVYPEELACVLNLKRLVADDPEAAVYAARVRKELWRAAAFALGAGNSTMQPCVMRTVTTLGELDAKPVAVCSPEPLMKMITALQERKAASVLSGSYKRACEEGWAPAPTNDTQRAIWSSVRSEKERGPASPIKIEKKR